MLSSFKNNPSHSVGKKINVLLEIFWIIKLNQMTLCNAATVACSSDVVLCLVDTIVKLNYLNLFLGEIQQVFQTI